MTVCEVPRYNPGELASIIKNELSARLLNGAPVIPLSTEDVISSVFAGAAFEVGGIANKILDESDPESQCCDNLIKWAGRRGIYLMSAERSRGFVTVTGTPDIAIPNNVVFMAGSKEYELDPTFDNPIVIGSSGESVVKVVSVNPGSEYNIAVGTQMVIGTSILGIDSNALATSEIMGGTEAEDCEAMRSRILDMRKRGVVSVNEKWFEAETYKYPGVTKVCIDRCNCCDSGWVVIYPFFGNTFKPYGVPPSNILEDMTKWMFGVKNGAGEGKAPIGVKGYYSCATPTFVNITVHGIASLSEALKLSIRTALDAWYLKNSCPGAELCKKDIEDVIKPYLAGTCYTSVTYSLDGLAATQDAANVYFECGYFPVAGTVGVGP